MSEQQINELENFLMTYATDRFDMSQAGYLGKMAQGMMGGRIQQMATWLVKAFIRGLYAVPDQIYLSDLANAVICETGYMIGARPFKMTSGTNVTPSIGGDTFYNLQTELHHWMIYLSEQGKLPGTYHRFIGKFVR